MSEIKLSSVLKKNIYTFIEGLKQVYGDGLVSVVLYGSAAAGEFIENHSNVNILIVLHTTDLSTLELSRKLVHKCLASRIEPLFLSREFLLNSGDVFPIEFLDMKENHDCLYGEDILKDINVDLANLRFQCEQELKSKIILLKQQYLKINPQDRTSLGLLLSKNVTSAMHIFRNLIRLKGQPPSYIREEILKEMFDAMQIQHIQIKCRMINFGE